MGAHPGSEGSRRGRAGRHRRTGQALITRRDHTAETPARRFTLPAPSPSALVGIAVLVLIAVGAVHLSGSGSAVPLEEASPQEITDGTSPSTGTPSANEPTEPTETTDGDETTETTEGAAAGAAPEDGASDELIVHVSGAVAAPGVVHLPGGARVDDALRAAGVATEEAELAAVNLARPLVDGEQIHVPLPGEQPPPAEDGPAAPTGGGEGSGPPGTDAGGAIDLNTAGAAELEELPGVGPAIAQRILEHREKNGAFTSVDGLLEVSGIGPATLEKIRAEATV